MNKYIEFYKNTLSGTIEDLVPFVEIDGVKNKDIILKKIEALSKIIIDSVNLYYEGKTHKASENFITNLNKNSILFILIFYFLSLIFYKIGVTRSDGGHIKQGGSLNTILFVYLVIYNILFLIYQKKYLKELNTNFYKYMNILFIFIFFMINVPNNYLKNTYNIKSRIVDYINTPDENFLKKDEIIILYLLYRHVGN